MEAGPQRDSLDLEQGLLRSLDSQISTVSRCDREVHVVSLVVSLRTNLYSFGQSRGGCYLRDGPALCSACLHAEPRRLRHQASKKKKTTVSTG